MLVPIGDIVIVFVVCKSGADPRDGGSEQPLAPMFMFVQFVPTDVGFRKQESGSGVVFFRKLSASRSPVLTFNVSASGDLSVQETDMYDDFQNLLLNVTNILSRRRRRVAEILRGWEVT